MVAHQKVESSGEATENTEDIGYETTHKARTSASPTRESHSRSVSPEEVDQRERNVPQLDLARKVDDSVSSSEDCILPRCPEWIQQASQEHHLRCHMRQVIQDSQRCPAVDDEQFWTYYDDHLSPVKEDSCHSISHYAIRAIMANSPLMPFRDPPQIMSLASVIGRNKSRNQDVDVLAVIESIDASTTKPTRLPLKRDIRIRDPSVEEAVTLSVFIDPENFRSSVGTIALFRHVTTHDWRRGNLNAYPARVNGKEWFIPTPYCLGFEQDIKRLDDWWNEQQA